MRLIDAEALKECIRKKLGIKSLLYCLPSEKTIVGIIDIMPTIETNRWITVSKDLPKCGQVVLWCNDQGSVFTSEITFKDGSSWAIGKKHRGARIVAWMPLPAAWEGEE